LCASYASAMPPCDVPRDRNILVKRPTGACCLPGPRAHGEHGVLQQLAPEQFEGLRSQPRRGTAKVRWSNLCRCDGGYLFRQPRS
jgi:hypothetical protein